MELENGKKVIINITTIIDVLDIIHRPVFLKQRFGDWVLSPSSGPEREIISVDWTQLNRLLPEDGDRIQSQKHCF
jgi:hypothetical protein